METTCRNVQALRDAGTPFVLLDCREDFEWQIARIEGAILLPMSQLSQRVSEIEHCKLSPIVVYCHHGVRSLHVARALMQHGFQNVVSMAGGIDEWSAIIDSTVPRY